MKTPKLNNVNTFITIVSLIVGIAISIISFFPRGYTYNVEVLSITLRDWMMKPKNSIQMLSEDRVIATIAYDGDKTFSIQTDHRLIEDNLSFAANDSIVKIKDFKVYSSVIELIGHAEKSTTEDTSKKPTTDTTRIVSSHNSGTETIVTVKQTKLKDNNGSKNYSNDELISELEEENSGQFVFTGKIDFNQTNSRQRKDDSLKVVLLFANGDSAERTISKTDTDFSFEIDKDFKQRNCQMIVYSADNVLYNELVTLDPNTPPYLKL